MGRGTGRTSRRRKGESDVAGDPPPRGGCGEVRAKGMDVDQVRSSGYTIKLRLNWTPSLQGPFHFLPFSRGERVG